MDSIRAERVIEMLRKGIPPDGYVRHFTVGREAEVRELGERLGKTSGGALLLKANYGSGKTHLLKFIREHALASRYAVSTVALDAKGAVRFNRMDQMFGAICRNIEIGEDHAAKGIRSFLDLVASRMDEEKTESFWAQLSSSGKWDFSEALDAPALFVALRAWQTNDPSVMDIVEDWLHQPWAYRGQRKKLYSTLVADLRRHFRDPRPDWQFYADDVFSFETQGHIQSWDGLRDLNMLACNAGLRGLIILFDEFEDVITNLRNISYQERAFWNLFQFYSGKRFPGATFYAVTPEFVQKCKNLLLEKGRWDYDFSRFDSLPTFQMSPLDVNHLAELAKRIVSVHGIAYEWRADEAMTDGQLEKLLERETAVQIQDRTRHAIIAVVKELDKCLQGAL